MIEDLTYGRETAQLAVDLLLGGVGQGMVVMRHACRHYDSTNLINEPFMGLTDEGKQQSFIWGNRFPGDTPLHFFSSHIGRCIETAYLMDKGHVAAGGLTRSNTIEASLSPFYIRDIQQLFKAYLPLPDFFSAWFTGRIPASVMMPLEEIAPVMRSFWRRRLLDNSNPNRVWNVGITHDWNLYVIRSCFFDLAVEEQDKVDYLDGVVVYNDRGRCYVATPGHSPKQLEA